MKIDIHTHTRRCKKGDAPSREISAKSFCEIVCATDVKIIAITNHNVFDLDQYKQILDSIDPGIQVWPGIELDIRDGELRGHLLVIVSPTDVGPFNDAVRRLIAGTSPDDFETSIMDVVEIFDSLGPIYVAHYRQKKPDLSDKAIAALMAGTERPSRVLKEVSNSISAGIYISHGYASIYGSDVHDWATYHQYARELPDLRLPVDSFEHFCLLLEKDATTINTALNRKTPEELILQPFEDGTFLKLTFYNDINVVFGAKGTGKSCILEAIAQYYSASGVNARVFESSGDRLDEEFDLKGKDLQVNLTDHGIRDSAEEIERLRNAKEADVTALGNYISYFSTQGTNRNAKRMRIKDIDIEEGGGARRAFEAVASAAETTRHFLEFIRTNEAVRVGSKPTELAEILRLLSELLDRLQSTAWQRFTEWKEIEFLNSAIKAVRQQIALKTGNPAKPPGTGFREYAVNRCRIARDVNAIAVALRTEFPVESEPVGNLGDDKGELELRTAFVFQNGTIKDGSYAPVAKVKKGTQREFAAAIAGVHQSTYRDNLFERIAQLNSIDDVESIRSLRELLLLKRYFALGGRPYVPSSGERAMVLLEHELRRDADIYILDEPEKSLGNEYISEVIVPLIKGHALAGKRVFISTHDANIAVRTLPYCSVYRGHDAAGYATYVGNPFSNDLVNVNDPTDTLDWRLVSMRTLEGGKSAFGERSRIYGNA